MSLVIYSDMKIWFLSTRISGNDGVSLEAVRWRNILVRMGHKVTFIAGELDRRGILIPELHFSWPKVVELHDKVVYGNNHYRKVEKEIFEFAGKIEGSIREALNGKKPDLIILANIFSLPMHFPLAVALSRVIEEYNIPTIARHHDFWWERKRFLKSHMFPFFKRWFPPNLPQISHVVISSIAKEELKGRTGIEATIIPDCFDFESEIDKLDSYSKNWRKDFGVKNDDIVFLQATRIVPRKRIELSIDLIKKLNNPKAILVVAGHSGDEGIEYEKGLKEIVKNEKLRVIFIGDYINSRRRIRTFYTEKSTPVRRRVYTLWDCFTNADFVTYPTLMEGFGNQFIEAVYFKKPIIVTPYEVYQKDIRPLNFDVIEMPDRVTSKVVKEVENLIEDKLKAKNITDKNFEIGRKNFSYQAVENKIQKILSEM